MRFLIFVLLACRALAQNATLEGAAINALTREPLAGVHITLVSVGMEGGTPNAKTPYGAISGPDGRYSIGTLPGGAYLAFPRHNGYIYAASPTLSIKPGESQKVTFEMTPRAVITGRVSDEYGDPVEGAQVEAESAAKNGPTNPFDAGMSQATDDHGRFRLSGAPGKYTVKVTPRPRTFAPGAGAEIRSDGTQPSSYGTTYYPGASAAESATAVEAVANREVGGIDVSLSAHRVLSISGTLSGTPPGDAKATVMLMIDGSGSFSTTVGPDGKFFFSALRPGPYTLMGRYDGGTQLRSAAVEVRLDSSDATVSLKLAGPEEVTGVLAFTDDQTGLDKLHVQLENGAPQNGAPRGDVGRDGAFRIGSVFPGKYKPQVVTLPEGAYIKSIQLDTSDVTGKELDFSRGVLGAKLKIAISRHGGQITGKVLGTDGKPFSVPLAAVLLMTTEDSIPKGITPGASTMVTGGSPFTLSGIRPGKYHLFAVDAVGTNNENALKAAFRAAETIEIKEGDRLTKDVTADAK